MYRKSLEQELNRMSYEQQKDLLAKIEDKEIVQYDDNVTALEVVVESVVNVIGFLFKKIF